ncbi:MAG: phosphoribosylanthranilate isomerase [Candidatus Omnitrophica bacterium]|nr:phosphoribosylanthranilate isomerase [Candidatus Omnitrophota bacterium]
MTRARDAETALRLGADAIGFVFAPSPRKVSPAQARSILKDVGPVAFSVGVFVNASIETILRTAEMCRLSAIQLHGDETPAFARGIASLKVFKAFRYQAGFSVGTMNRYPADAYFIENGGSVLRGGSGRTWDWKALKGSAIQKPFFVSGGLHPENVRQAIRTLRLYGVDVSSGVESRPGIKCARRLKAFIQNVRSATEREI